MVLTLTFLVRRQFDTDGPLERHVGASPLTGCRAVKRQSRLTKDVWQFKTER